MYLAALSLLPRSFMTPLENATSTIETIFLQTGQGLGMGVEDLMGLRKALARLSVMLGEEETQTLMTLCVQSVEHSADISADVQTFVSMAKTLRAGIRKIQSNVSHLSVVIRTMSASAPISRILGNSLSTREPKIDEFSIELARIASTADEQLKSLQDRLETIVHDMADLDLVSLNLSRDMTETVGPALRGLEEQVSKIQRDRHDLAAGNAVIETGMRDIFAEVSAIVGELQTGDSVRQRLEHINVIARAALDAALAQERQDASDALTYLAVCQAEESRDDITGDVQSVLQRLTAIQLRAEQVLSAAEQVYLDPNDTQRKRVSAMIACADSLSAALMSSQVNLDTLLRINRMTQEHIEAIQGLAADMGLLDHQIRLLGLNTFIVCCNIGSEACALQELSRQVLSLTRTSNEIFDQIDATTTALAATPMPDVLRAADKMSRTIAIACDLTERLQGTDQAVGGVKAACAIEGYALKTALHASHKALSSFERADSDLASVISDLRGLISPVNCGRTEYDVLASEQGRLDQLYAIYTMGSERRGHDRIFSGRSDFPAPPATAPQDSRDALADIFF